VNFRALAADYDGTIADGGRVAAKTVHALIRLRKFGLKLILVTGRQLPDLLDEFSAIAVFDQVVAENGALLFDPKTRRETVIGEPPPPEFIARLRTFKVTPLSVGRSIVATREPNESAVLAAIRELGLELHIVFNKGAVMVLSANVNKTSGLAVALDRMGIPFRDVVGIGDAENDQSFLQRCGLAVAVDNALPSVKAITDLVVGPCGVGIEELSRLLIETDLRDRHHDGP
jgi:hydroxymethylpyrimidine pyrophosphatase-like HAD family hydrolase